MTREMNKPDWHNQWVQAQQTGDYRFIGAWAAYVIENAPKQPVLDEWVKPFVDELNERLGCSRTVDYKGNEQVWYESKLIERIKQECQEAIDAYDKEHFFEDDCDKFLGASFMAQRILDLIQENEG